MEQDNRSFVHDTINLDEIRALLTMDDAASEQPLESILDEFRPEEEPDVYPSTDMESVVTEEVESLDSDENAEPLESDVSETVDMDDAALLEGDVSEAAGMSEEMADQDTQEAETPESEKLAADAPQEPQSEPKADKKKTSIVYELYCMLHDVIYLLAAVTLIFVFVVRLVGVQGESMLPTLHNNDILLLESNFLYRGDDLCYGDIVVLNVPYYEAQGEGPIVKRVIATAGQTVDLDFETGSVYVDGVLLQEEYINTPTNNNWEGEYALEYPAVVPEGCIFVLGDNRNNSMDSRYAPIGMIDTRCVLGKVQLVALPGQTTDNRGAVIDPRDWGRIGLVS